MLGRSQRIFPAKGFVKRLVLRRRGSGRKPSRSQIRRRVRWSGGQLSFGRSRGLSMNVILEELFCATTIILLSYVCFLCRTFIPLLPQRSPTILNSCPRDAESSWFLNIMACSSVIPPQLLNKAEILDLLRLLSSSISISRILTPWRSMQQSLADSSCRH